MILRTLAGFFVLTLVVPCQGQERGGTSSKVALPWIMTVMSKAQISGSLEYSGRCDDKHRFPDFPAMRTPRQIDRPPLQTLREMFADDPTMQVTQDASGLIRMVEADVPRDLLNVRINHLSFDPRREGDPVGNPFWGRGVIFSSPEVIDFMRSQNIDPGVVPWAVELSSIPGPKRIHGGLDNVTVSQALDYVLQTFPGLWIYENCGVTNGKLGVSFTFYENSKMWELQDSKEN